MERLPERIEVEGLLLRRWAETDAEALGAAVEASIEHLRPWMPWTAEEPLAAERRRALLRRWQRDWEAGGDVMFGILCDGEVAGSCGLRRRAGPETLEIGYWVHLAHLRRGLATRAATALTAAALSQPAITAVEIHHDRANVRSAGIPPRLGYRLVEERARAPAAPAEIGVECVWRRRREEL